jgi:hypothetical protein
MPRRHRHTHDPGGAALEAHMRGNQGAVPYQGDVFEYQARHSLAVAVAGASIFPKAREVFGQRQDLRLLLLGESTVVVEPVFVEDQRAA